MDSKLKQQIEKYCAKYGYSFDDYLRADEEWQKEIRDEAVMFDKGIPFLDGVFCSADFMLHMMQRPMDVDNNQND